MEGNFMLQKLQEGKLGGLQIN